MWKFIQRIPCKWFLFFVTAFTISLKMRAPNYRCGRLKLDKLGAHMASGVLKLFATLECGTKVLKKSLTLMLTVTIGNQLLDG